MFDKKENTNGKITTMLGAGSSLQGDFSAYGSARIDGTVNGNVELTGSLILGPAGKIIGDVKAESAVIGGEVLGDVFAPEKAEITATAKVLGDVTTRTIVIDENAVFQGRCNMNIQETPKQENTDPSCGKLEESNGILPKSALQEALRKMEQEEASPKTAPAGKEADEAALTEANADRFAGRNAIMKKMMDVLEKDAEDGRLEEQRFEKDGK